MQSILSWVVGRGLTKLMNGMEVKTYADIEYCSSLMFEGDMRSPEGRQIHVKQAEKTITRQWTHLPHQWIEKQVAANDDILFCEAMSAIEEYNTSLHRCRAQVGDAAIESRWLGGSIMSLNKRCGYNLCVTSRSWTGRSAMSTVK
ncbi:hypothetical protein BTUL_0154g00330 [Botrytis tulipae]|uniref:Uncharacterized protein n=1 Tax=Botrytis tulipae TaxID=87230 RepID=A0A4Z1EE75_9HELO|nr:hypothetical protein BTUL_0154g00330 [Botrytis tulipae]